MPALLVILVLGFAIRLYDLTDLPLDFHPTRQLLSALKARGMYYQTLENVPDEQRDFAIQQWKTRASVEPALLERMVAFTYRFTGEQLWIARIYSSLFWVIGAVFLFLLAREFASVDGALAATAIYLILPYAVAASRSFQPDPLMVMLIIVFWWAVVMWSKDSASYKFAILAGLFGGFAIFVKFVAAFFVIAGGLGAVPGRGSVREMARRPQFYVMCILGILPSAALFHLWSVDRGLSQSAVRWPLHPLPVFKPGLLSRMGRNA
jgi:4-amino-4-deoxy-L-arabinose transferase-like glycosyltransferase